MTRWRSTNTSCPICARSGSPRWSRPWTPTPPIRRRPPARRRLSSSGSRRPGSSRSSRSSRSTPGSPSCRPRPSSSSSRSCSSPTTRPPITVGLGLIPVPYEKALDGQEGISTLTLGGIDDPRPESQGGYDPQVRSCYNTWLAAYPKTPPGKKSPHLEEQGPVVGWCQAIRLFAAAAIKAGHDLNRRTFVEAMAGIRNFPGTWTRSSATARTSSTGRRSIRSCASTTTTRTTTPAP